jgi:hypothetical protein
MGRGYREAIIANINKGAVNVSADREKPWTWDFRLHVAPPGLYARSQGDTRRGEGGYERNWQRRIRKI